MNAWSRQYVHRLIFFKIVTISIVDNFKYLFIFISTKIKNNSTINYLQFIDLNNEYIIHMYIKKVILIISKNLFLSIPMKKTHKEQPIFLNKFKIN